MKPRTDVLGLGDVTPDRHTHEQDHHAHDHQGHHHHDGHEHHHGHEPREGVGPAGDVERSATGSLHRSKGATGIDMGAGGEGTDIKP